MYYNIGKNGDEIMIDQNKIKLYTLENDKYKVVISNLGATIINFFTKDKDGNEVDIVLGHKNLEDYISNPGTLGSVVGRNANRIENANIIINKIQYNLEVNDNHNNLHTGSAGVQFKLFTVDEYEDSLIMKVSVKDLEDRFPGNLDITVVYRLDNEGLLVMYDAVSDMDTIINLTNHTYFNLNGQDNSNIYNHDLYVNSNLFMPNNEFSFPTREILSNKDTPFDFTKKTNLKEALNSDYPQIKNFNGMDHNFLLNTPSYYHVACLSNEDNDIKLNVYTNLNAMHIYTANHFPDESTLGKNGMVYPLHGGIAFETQLSPNSMQMPWLKSPIVKANERYQSFTKFKVGLLTDK